MALGFGKGTETVGIAQRKERGTPKGTGGPGMWFGYSSPAFMETPTGF